MKSYLPGLNTVRFCAAMNVVMLHFPGFGDYSTFPFFSGPNAVTIFFVLSGYLITYRLLLEHKERGAINLKTFYIRRELRILPLYYLVVLIGGFLLPLIGAPAPSPEAMMSILLMVPQLISAYSLPAGVLLPLWSIGVEELFYLFFPLAMRIFPLVRVCFVVIIGSTLLGIITAALNSPLFPLLRIMRFECMAVGALAAWLVVTRSHWLSIVHHRVVEIAAIGMLLLIAVFQVPLPFYDLTFSIIVAVFLLNLSTNPDPIIRLEWRWSKAAGELSYGIYIWHLPILWAFSTVLSGLPYVVVSLIVTVMVAWTSYHLIERPILRLKDRFQPVV